jgi:hypothetical protein
MSPDSYRLEPEWAVVVLAALVYSGDICLSIPGKKFDATNISEIVAVSIKDLIYFKHIDQPKVANVQAIKSLFELIGLTPGLAQLVTQGKPEPILELQKKVADYVERIVMTDQALLGGIPFWGQSLLSKSDVQKSQDELSKVKNFLESLQAYSSPGKIKNFRYTPEEVSANKSGLDKLVEIDELVAFANELGPMASYLSTAEAVLPLEDDWMIKERDIRKEIMGQVTDLKASTVPDFKRQINQKFNKLKKEYIKVYLDLHSKARLGANEDKRKAALIRDERLEILKKLATIELMPASQLTDFQNHLAALVPCYQLTEKDIESNPICPHCSFRPATEQVGVSAAIQLSGFEDKLDELIKNWTDTLISNLKDPTTEQNLSLLKASAKKKVENFIEKGELPEKLDNDFLDALREVLSGLVKLEISLQDLRDALLAGGSPATVEEIKDRLDSLMTKLTKGKEADKVRIVLKS